MYKDVVKLTAAFIQKYSLRTVFFLPCQSLFRPHNFAIFNFSFLDIEGKIPQIIFQVQENEFNCKNSIIQVKMIQPKVLTQLQKPEIRVFKWTIKYSCIQRG